MLLKKPIIQQKANNSAIFNILFIID